MNARNLSANSSAKYSLKHSVSHSVKKLALGFTIGLSAFSSNASQPMWTDEVKELITQEIKRYNLPSLQVAIGQSNKITFEHASGFADIENRHIYIQV